MEIIVNTYSKLYQVKEAKPLKIFYLSWKWLKKTLQCSLIIEFWANSKFKVYFKILITRKLSSFWDFTIREYSFILGCFTHGRSLCVLNKNTLYNLNSFKLMLMKM